MPSFFVFLFISKKVPPFSHLNHMREPHFFGLFTSFSRKITLNGEPSLKNMGSFHRKEEINGAF